MARSAPSWRRIGEQWSRDEICRDRPVRSEMADDEYRSSYDRVMEPEPEPTEGYSIDSIYGRKKTDEEQENYGYGSGRKPNRLTAEPGQTMDEPDPEQATQGYSIEDVYGRKNSRKTDGDESSSYVKKPSTIIRPGRTSDEPDPTDPTQGYSIDSTYGKPRPKADDVESEDSSEYRRKTSSAGRTTDEPDPEEPTQGYSLESTYGRKKTDDDDEGSKEVGYGSRKASYTGGEDDTATEGYSLEDTYGKKDEDSSEESQGKRFVRKNDDEELASSAAGLSLGSGRYSKGDSENSSSDSSNDDEEHRGPQGRRHRKKYLDDEE
ncbi:hypothetical protein R1flu_012050 [Riccia fluitans]|uniref:Uncharacterized protein n=1 Tax=Riccia fluitans TaxID=41844 RepID=A0ABD1ZAM7_9MARC